MRKINLIARCELAPASKFRYLFDWAAGFFLPALQEGYREYRMRGDRSVVLRGNSTDGKVFEEIFIEQTYAAQAKAIQPKAPVILIDLGANIGLSSIALARELQPLAIVAVEPDPGNFAMLEENMRRARLTDRCAAIQAFAGVQRGFAELIDSGNGAWGMRMGAPARTGVPVIPIEDIISMAQSKAEAMGEAGVGAKCPDSAHRDAMHPDANLGTTGRATIVLKCDIEGAEAPLFRRLDQWEDRVHYVILELHTEFLSAQDFHACLGASRYHWRIEGRISPDAVLAVIALERLDPKRLQLKASAQSQRASGC